MTTGFVLLGLGGPGVQIPTLRIAMLFPDKQELIGSLNASLFDASCFVFFAMQLVQERWNVSLKSLFLAYAAWIVLLFLSYCFVLPLLICKISSEKCRTFPRKHDLFEKQKANVYMFPNK